MNSNKYRMMDQTRSCQCSCRSVH